MEKALKIILLQISSKIEETRLASMIHEKIPFVLINPVVLMQLSLNLIQVPAN